MTEIPNMTKKTTEKLTEMMFEQFGVPGFYLANQGSLALTSMGLTSGVCVNVGYNFTQAIPIYETSVINHAVSFILE
jgi:actin-related protein